MGWHYPNISWSEFEKILSDGKTSSDIVESAQLSEPKVVSHKPRHKYAELHCHSNFSFLDGASSPEALVEEAVLQGLEGLAITDHDGFYGVVRFASAAKKYGLRTIFGSELTVDLLDTAAAQKDPDGSHLLVLCRNAEGYASLSRLISHSQMAGQKGAPRLSLESIDSVLSTRELSNLVVLTGCRKSLVPAALAKEGFAQAREGLGQLIDIFGKDSVFVELWDHDTITDDERNDSLFRLAKESGVGHLATNNVHYANLSDRNLAMAIASVRARSSMQQMAGWLPSAPSSYIRSGDEQARRFRRFPGSVENAYQLGLECSFDLSLIAPNLPPFDCPNGLSEIEFLSELVESGARRRYGSRSEQSAASAWKQIDHELSVIRRLNFAGYFLIVWDIVRFCETNNIYCQGRGSAANSAVCYVLGVTKADAVGLGLLFERFLSAERDGPPDIDLDIESGRREEVIQYVYSSYGRQHAAQVSNVISYKAKSAVRDASKALGYSPGQQDAFSKSVSSWGPSSDSGSELPLDVLELAMGFETLPRHLGIHVGGMVVCDRPLVEVCPIEPARMPGRTVLQWDKDDCAEVGLVKFDLLGLGMLSALHYTVDEIKRTIGADVDLAEIKQEDAVYNMLCRADTVGVFQVESRAQMSTLPRLKPRTFYDLVVEIALIRPGPIQGGSVHPYIRRRCGEEPITYLHPLLEPALKKTLGVPLFQEQLMQIAIDVANFEPVDADKLRQAMASKRSQEKMNSLKVKFFQGMTSNDVPADVQNEIWAKLAAFANFGFPESHSISFAYLVYSSSWLKLHYPAAFCVGLLNAQPMGFYSPHSLIQDARRHGVTVNGVCINRSSDESVLEQCQDDESKISPPVGYMRTEDVLLETIQERFDKNWAVRLGLNYVKNLGKDLAKEIVANQPYKSIEEFVRKTGASADVLEALAAAGAFDSLVADRRRALWTVGALHGSSDAKLEGVITGLKVPDLPRQDSKDLAVADLVNTGLSIDGHPTKFFRRELAGLGVLMASQLADCKSSKAKVAGVVTHKQRPPTAHGVTFLTLEDETGLINVVVSQGCWTRFASELQNNSILMISGRLESKSSVINIIAEKVEAIAEMAVPDSRDFR